jgi:hypothetical protein
MPRKCSFDQFALPSLALRHWLRIVQPGHPWSDVRERNCRRQGGN